MYKKLILLHYLIVFKTPNENFLEELSKRLDKSSYSKLGLNILRSSNPVAPGWSKIWSTSVSSCWVPPGVPLVPAATDAAGWWAPLVEGPAPEDSPTLLYVHMPKEQEISKNCQKGRIVCRTWLSGSGRRTISGDGRSSCWSRKGSIRRSRRRSRGTHITGSSVTIIFPTLPKVMIRPSSLGWRRGGFGDSGQGRALSRGWITGYRRRIGFVTTWINALSTARTAWTCKHASINTRFVQNSVLNLTLNVWLNHVRINFSWTLKRIVDARLMWPVMRGDRWSTDILFSRRNFGSSLSRSIIRKCWLCDPKVCDLKLTWRGYLYRRYIQYHQCKD